MCPTRRVRITAKGLPVNVGLTGGVGTGGRSWDDVCPTRERKSRRGGWRQASRPRRPRERRLRANVAFGIARVTSACFRQDLHVHRSRRIAEDFARLATIVRASAERPPQAVVAKVGALVEDQESPGAIC